jgi:hypothetical protein
MKVRMEQRTTTLRITSRVAKRLRRSLQTKGKVLLTRADTAKANDFFEYIHL